MRSLLLGPVALLALLSSCGRGFEPRPPGTRPDPLVPCEELGRVACGARADCAVESLFCAALCADDGQGGCLPCDAFQCVPVLPPPPPACEDLDATSCGARRDCELTPAVCPMLCAADDPAGCLPCDDAARCVTRTPPPSHCDGLDGPTCVATPGCDIVGTGVCPECVPGGSCPPCSDAIACVPVGPPQRCEDLGAATCDATPGCVLVTTAACPECGPNMLCGPCEETVTCVASPPPSPCAGLDEVVCEATPGCGVVATGACPPCSGDVCPACVVAVACVEMEEPLPPSPCFGFDLATCTTHPECEVVTFACTAECRDDGQGGCLPCDAPGPSCQPRAEEPVVGCGAGGSQPPQP